MSLCVSSGQVFRWERSASGSWFGVEGNSWYIVDQHLDLSSVLVRSNSDAVTFQSLFRLDWDSEEVVAKILRCGPELAPFVGQLPGLRVLRPSSPMETFISFMCTPNNNVARIGKMVRFLGSMGPALHAPFSATRFPDVDRVAQISPSELRDAGFGYRAETIPRAAAAVSARGGVGWLEQLKRGAYEDAFVELQTIPGVGPKLADCIALFALHHTCAAPVDTHLWQAVVRLYKPDWAGKSLTHARYRQIGDFLRDRFGELAGWAHQYLFYENLLNWRGRS